MARITCPNCGEIIEVDPSQVEDLTRQLRDELFAHDLAERLAEADRLHGAKLQAVREEERREADRRVASVEATNAQLKAQAEAAAQASALEVERARAAAADELTQLKAQLAAQEQRSKRDVEQAQAASREELARLRAQLDAAAQAQELALQRERAQAAERQAVLQHRLDEQQATQDRQLADQQAQAQAQLMEAARQAQARETELVGQVEQLKAQLSSQELALRAQGEAEVLRATSELERSKNELASQLSVARAQSEQAQSALREQMAQREAELAQQSERQLEAKNEQIEQYKAEVERLRDYRVRLSTKLIGESLERHCEAEFNRIRMQAYPHASFEKDNEAVGGTKGDFIFRDFDDEGNELLSIMFEMKNEEELSSSTSRKRNEDHFKKLDADRTKKACEYAVLVSTLEPDNDFYNAGIADVSWRYPKMFVVRPQCFTTIIGLLKAAALAAHPYKLQLERTRREELDVTKFETKVSDIVGGIARDYTQAAKNYEQAEKDIDAIIAKLQHLKAQLGTAVKHFDTAGKRGEKLSVKRLTWGNPTMKAAFAEAAEARGQRGPEPAADEPLDPDELE